jgi:hypothetical protein
LGRGWLGLVLAGREPRLRSARPKETPPTTTTTKTGGGRDHSGGSLGHHGAKSSPVASVPHLPAKSALSTQLGVPPCARHPRVAYPGPRHFFPHPGSPHSASLLFLSSRTRMLGFAHRPLVAPRALTALRVRSPALTRAMPCISRPALAARDSDGGHSRNMESVQASSCLGPGEA